MTTSEIILLHVIAIALSVAIAVLAGTGSVLADQRPRRR